MIRKYTSICIGFFAKPIHVPHLHRISSKKVFVKKSYYLGSQGLSVEPFYNKPEHLGNPFY